MDDDSQLSHHYIFKYSVKRRKVMTVKRWDFIKNNSVKEKEEKRVKTTL